MNVLGLSGSLRAGSHNAKLLRAAGDLLPPEAELWLDGAHNPTAARAIADHFRGLDRPFHLIFGLLANKDAPGVLQPFRGRSLIVHTIPVPDHEHHAPADLAALARDAGLTAMTAAGVEDALGWIARHADRGRPPIVLILDATTHEFLGDNWGFTVVDIVDIVDIVDRVGQRP